MLKLAQVNEKGGSGKSTLSLNLAHALALEGARVLVIDADPQGTATDWLSVRDDGSPAPFRVIGLPKPIIHKEIGELSRGYDAVIIDAPPKNEDILRSAIAAASHVVVPVQPSGADLWPTRRVIDTIGQARVFDESKKAAYCLTRVIAGSVIGRDFAAEALTYGLPVLAGFTVQRVAYAEAMSAGLTVFEIDATGPAAVEIRAILAAIKDM